MKMKIKNDHPYVIIRGDRSGVFAGFLIKKEGTEVELEESRRLWYWNGAASISQIAINGVSKPENCKFPEAVPSQSVLDVIEIIPCSEESYDCIKGIKPWKS